MRENVDQNNSEYEHFLRSENDYWFSIFYVLFLKYENMGSWSSNQIAHICVC